MTIALYGRPFAADGAAPVRELLALLQSRGVYMAVHASFHAFLQKVYAPDTLPPAVLFTDRPPADTDCLLSIGGDGTFLGCLPHVRDSGIPVAGINLGRLGFLSAASLGALHETVEALLAHRYTIETRTLLAVRSAALPPDIYPYALNEAGVQRKTPAMIGVHVRLDDNLLPTYWADGLLIATPTGSTAYSMSVGGPIVVPQSKSLVLSPIAPHNLSIRSLVISDDTQIALTVETRDSNAFLTIDNQLVEITPAAAITVCKADFTLRVIRLPHHNFFDSIREKLLWGQDRRNPY